MTTTQPTPSAGTPEGESEMRPRQPKAITRHLPTAARILLGLLFLMTGLMGALSVMPPSPPSLPEAAVAFNMGMMK
ncbi:hypothetical protein EON80_31500, partial [bacterium]